MDDWLLDFVSRYGYLGIMLILSLGIVGLPLPDELLLTFTGYLVYKGHLTFVFSLFSGFFGGFFGISSSFGLGHLLGMPFLKKYGPKLYMTPERVKRVRQYFEKYGRNLLLVGFFIPGVRHAVGYLAGMSALSYRQFAVFAGLGAFLWSLIFITLGMILGQAWYSVEDFMHGWRKFAVILAFVLIAAGIAAVRQYRRKIRAD